MKSNAGKRLQSSKLPLRLTDLRVELRKTLSCIKQWIEARQQTKSSDSKPSAVGSEMRTRVGTARARLQDECQHFNEICQQQQRDSPLRYWMSKQILQEIEKSWTTLDLAEVAARIEFLAEREKFLQELIPDFLLAQFDEAQGSPGKLALALNQARSRTAELAENFLALESQFKELNKRRSQEEVILANVQAKNDFATFETSVLRAPRYLERRQESGKLGGFGLEHLHSLRERRIALAAENRTFRATVDELRTLLSKAIDLFERSKRIDEADELFLQCQEIVTRHADLLTPASSRR